MQRASQTTYRAGSHEPVQNGTSLDIIELLEVVPPGLCSRFNSLQSCDYVLQCSLQFCVCMYLENVEHFTFVAAFVLCYTISFAPVLLSWQCSDWAIWLARSSWPKQKLSYSSKSGSVWRGHLKPSFKLLKKIKICSLSMRIWPSYWLSTLLHLIF